MINNNFWDNKRILITGHTGFKGSWLTIWLKLLGAEVTGYALKPYTANDNFVVTDLQEHINHVIGDVRDFERLEQVFNDNKPEIVFHLAAQSLVRESYLRPKTTYDVNVGGTVNVLECCKKTASVRVVINITSDKCYDDNMPNEGYTESNKLGGYDPYSSSKACSEMVTESYRNLFSEISTSHPISISSVRAGNVIGGGDWRPDRLVPDCIRALERNENIVLRNPDSIRPWQHVLEPLSGYLALASKNWDNLDQYSQAWNFGPDLDSMKKVREVVNLLILSYGNGNWVKQNSSDNPHESPSLILDSSKAKSELAWVSKWNIDKAISTTVEWYKSEKGTDFYDLCEKQIYDYMD